MKKGYEMDRLIDKLNADEMLRRHGKYYSTQIAIISDDDETRFDIHAGRVSEGDNSAEEHGFRLVAGADVWERYCQDIPPPGFNELGALIGSGNIRVEGDMYSLQSNFMFVRRLLEVWKADKKETTI